MVRVSAVNQQVNDAGRAAPPSAGAGGPAPLPADGPKEGPPAAPKRRLAPGATALAAALIVGAAPVGRAWFEGREALMAADRALRAGETRVALDHARDAAGWWLPGSPFAEGAFARMRHIGHTAEANGDLPGALGAFRALLASAARVQWPTAQLETEVSHARAALARIEARKPSGEPSREASGAEKPKAPRGVEVERVGAGAALSVAGGLGLFALGAAACLRRGGAAVAARWPFALAGAGLLLAAFGFGGGLAGRSLGPG